MNKMMEWERKYIQEMMKAKEEAKQLVEKIDKEELVKFVLETRHILDAITFANKPIKNTSKQDVYEVVEELVNKYMTNRPFINDASFLMETFLKENE